MPRGGRGGLSPPRSPPPPSLPSLPLPISSIHLLKTFINANNYSEKVLIAQTAIHIAFLLSAMAIAATDRLMPQRAAKHAGGTH